METPLTPLEFARRARKLYPERIAVIDGNSRWTYAEFLNRCDRWSTVLQKLGISPGDRVAYLSPNTHAQLESFYAVPQIGAVLVPLNYRLTADDFVYLINHSGSRVVCADRDYLGAIDSVRAHLPGVKHFIALSCSVGSTQPKSGWLNYEAMVDASRSEFVRPNSHETDLLTINYTSGTTSHPKGVMITHRNAWMNSIGTLLYVPMTCADRYLWTLPMFHANGWTFVWTVTAAGATHICLRKVEPRTVFNLMATEQITTLCAAPTVLIALANAPKDLRRLAPKGIHVITAGAPPAAATIQRLEEGLGWTITHVYGLTETAPFITVCEARAEHASLPISKRAAIKARQGVELITSGELRVVDTQNNDVPQDGATQGEIVARGNVVMAGYYKDPDATERAMHGGWFHTGDAAVVHPDGYVEICDRLKDVIISGGENISSVEVEGVLLRHPAVQEVAIVGFPHERWGEAPHAFVVLREGASANERELCEFARANLAHFKAPHSVTFVEKLPKTATGKIQKYILRARRPAIAPQ
ncbi:MAG TPA: long-chain-fatty-acid--CoA ligase [Candidatus Udaeobacter sp.]|jgi:fatty-acyl-CoA synthase|nr:long-chain-fatty-acid--CoA ligase [Candidatus Udaeobacter sp.]